MCVFFLCICSLFCTLPLLCSQGVRKDRGRVLRRDKRWTGTRDKSTRELGHRTVPPQHGRKRSSSAGAGKSPVAGMPPDQVLIHVETMTIYSRGKFDLEGPRQKALDKRSKGCIY